MEHPIDGATRKHPGFNQEPTHPVVGVNWNDANAFCEWLTKKEHASGLLPRDKVYGCRPTRNGALR
jgi:sulfatase modifying factor 1